MISCNTLLFEQESRGKQTEQYSTQCVCVLLRFKALVFLLAGLFVFSVSFCLNSGLALKKKKNMQTNIPLNHKLLFCILLAIIPLFKLYYSLQSGHAVWNEALCQIKGSYSEKRPFTTEGSELKQTRNPSSRVLMLRSVRKGCCKSQFQPLQRTQRSLSLSPVVRTPYGKPLSI